MAKKVIYFGKVNITSKQVYNLYNGDNIYNVLSPILEKFNEKLTYVHKFSYMYEDKLVEDEIKYIIRIKEKKDTYIWGYLSKEGKIPYKEENSAGELVSRYITNTERIEFYYDVFKEKIGYYTSNRFGKTEILNVFENMLNRMYDEDDFPMTFSVSKYTQGLSIEQIENELKAIKNIQKLKFTFRPVNPDSMLLKKIKENGKDKLEEFEDANLSTKHVELTSASRIGLNLDSNMIREELNYASSLNRNLSVKQSTQNGYVKIEATGKNGITYSTEDRAQVKKEINNVIEFKSACQDLINKGKL